MPPYTFELFAPYNKQAGLRLKSGNARMFGIDIPMELDEKDGYWRTTVDLADGIYHYQFKIVTKSWFEQEPEPALADNAEDENIQIRQDEYTKLVQEVHEQNQKREEEAKFTEVWYTFVDPYATEVDERGSDDPFRSVGIVIFKNGKRVVDEYEWKYDNFVPLVPNENLIIYELHIGDFENQFKNVTARIDYFVQLGITAVEIMPIKEFPGSIGWGYTPRYYFAVESSYGTTVDFKEMIDMFHKHGIRVIMDGVYNHCDVSAPYTAIDHDYWFHHNPKDAVYCWGPEWNYDKYDEKYQVWPARKYIGDSIRYFIKEFHTDGIRFDAAAQIAHEEFLGEITRQAKEQVRDRGFAPNFICIGEYLPDQVESTISNGGPMDSVWHETLYWKLRDAILFDILDWEDLKNGIDARRRGYKSITDVVNYQSNHDHDRLLVELGKERQIFDIDAFRRVQMAVTIQATAFGLLMIWMGEELGEYKEKTPDVAKLDWNLLGDREDNSNAINKQQLQYYKDLLHLRKSNSALTSPHLEFIYENLENRILAWHRWNATSSDENSPNNHLIVVCNHSSTSYENYRVLDIPRNGRWYEWLNNDKEYFVEDNVLQIDGFLDHTARIFVYQVKKGDQNQRSVA